MANLLPKMAGAMGRETVLPTIKCSNCGAEIEISMMGDHLCSTASQRKNAIGMRKPVDTNRNAASRPAESSFRFKDTPPLSYRTNGSGNDSLKPGRTAPPRIDPQAASRFSVLSH